MQATTTRPQAATPAAAPSPVRTPQAVLGGVIETMDAIAQDALMEIAAVAAMAEAFMETPECYRNPGELAYVLRTIRIKAEEAQHTVTATATEAGYPYADEAFKKRESARARARAG